MTEMIENELFKSLVANKEIRAAADKRGLKISECGNAIVLSNRFYGFFFMDIKNEDQLDAWLIDRRLIKQTHTLNRLVSNNYELSEYRNAFKAVLANVSDDSSEVKVSGKMKLAELIFYAALIGDRVDGIETGTIDLPNESLHPIVEGNWLKWNSCMT